MRHLATGLWIALLVVAVSALGFGFVGGSSLGRAGAAAIRDAAPVHVAASLQSPEPIVFERGLHGARGSDVAFDPLEMALESIVVERPAGWALEGSPALRDRVRLAIVVREIGYDSAIDARFAAIPFALTFAVGGDRVPTRVLRDDPRALLVDVGDAVHLRDRLQKVGAGGVLTSLTDARSAAAVQILPASTFVIDGMAGGDAAYRAARARHIPAATRDIVIDAREDPAYVAFMLKQSAAIAQRTGVAIAIAHARPATYSALRATLPKLVRDGVDIVPVGTLAR